jgi:hypothetical protein
MSVKRINDAIRECLDKCYQSPNSLAVLADFVAELRNRSDWSVSEVEQVETTVRRLLTAMVDEG